MDVMQAIASFKQNLEARPAAKAAASPGRPEGAAQSASETAGASSSSRSSAGSTTITANDFLQLLVAEMKNQDPTADQDPNAYIDQLVQVNSLQQLIAINQDLTPPSTNGGTTAGQSARAPLGPAALGSADGTPAAILARSMGPKPAQPLGAPVRDPSSPNPSSGMPPSSAFIQGTGGHSPSEAWAAGRAALRRSSAIP